MPRAIVLAPVAAAALAMSACAMQAGGASAADGGVPAQSPAGTAQPPSSERPGAAVPRQFHLGAAAQALVAQAHQQAAGGEYGQAAATLERAVRIEPDNPLVWIELGRVRLGENNAAQADALAHKALALASGDPAAQAAAWRLIASAARARDRNADAYDADRRAQGLSPN